MSSLEKPVLTVNDDAIHLIDTRNAKSLFDIWRLFSRCSGSIEEGRRLENLSWRLWNRETSCCAPNEKNTTTSAISILQRNSEGHIPDLSRSFDSIDDEANDSDNEIASTSAPPSITSPRVRRQDSGCNRSRGKERHITPDDLEKMVITIREKKDLDPLPTSLRSYFAPLSSKINSPQITSSKLSNTATPIIFAPEPDKASPQKSPASATADGASATSRSATIVAHEFSPSQTPLYRSAPLPPSVPKPAPDSITKHGTSQSDTDESAIDDWEDVEEDKENIEQYFPRRESPQNLKSGQSLISVMLKQKPQDTASGSTPALRRSRTSSPQHPSDAQSPESDDSEPLTMKSRMRPGQEAHRTVAQPIRTTTNVTPHQAALSPKTTRRQMLATELTASLRRHLLWERKQKNQTALAVLKRTYTAHDVASLKQYPDKVHLGTEEKGDHGSWNQYFGQGLGEYHSKGW